MPKRHQISRRYEPQHPENWLEIIIRCLLYPDKSNPFLAFNDTKRQTCLDSLQHECWGGCENQDDPCSTDRTDQIYIHRWHCGGVGDNSFDDVILILKDYGFGPQTCCVQWRSGEKIHVTPELDYA